jgi:predicted site-specific integrase-resolvase
MLLHTEAETAKILRVSERTLQRWREVGTGPAFTRLSTRGRIVYSDNAIQEYVTKRTFGSIAAADAAEALRRD